MLYSTLAHNLIILCLLCPILTNYKFTLVSCTYFGFQKFHVLHLNYEKFKLYLQNTLNSLKTSRVYFGVLQHKFHTYALHQFGKFVYDLS